MTDKPMAKLLVTEATCPSCEGGIEHTILVHQDSRPLRCASCRGNDPIVPLLGPDGVAWVCPGCWGRMKSKAQEQAGQGGQGGG